MGLLNAIVARPRSLGIFCAIGAVLLGLAYMAAAGAPMHYLGVNAASLVLGLIVLALIGRLQSKLSHWSGVLTLMLAMLLLGTAFFGAEAEGAARWLNLGYFVVQPSLVVLPAMIVAFARSRNALSTIGMIVAAIALAIQPDRAMAGTLAAALAVLAFIRADRFAVPAFASSLVAFAVTLMRADTLPPMPFVEQVFFTSFQVHVLAGLAVLFGAVLLLVPAFVGSHYDCDNRVAYVVFGVIWFAIIMSAALGNYPTPVVGYGAAAVLGYVLSLFGLPKQANLPNATGAARQSDEGDVRPKDQTSPAKSDSSPTTA